MLKLHQSHEQLPVTQDMLSNTERTIGDSPALPICHSDERSRAPQVENGSCPGKSPTLKWETLLILAFVALSFAAFLLCGWILSAKCRSGGPNSISETPENIESHINPNEQ